jgi:flagellar assembly protein FliH
MLAKSLWEAAVKMPSSSRIVFAEDLAGASPWKPGPLGGMGQGTGAASGRGFDAPVDEPPAPGYEEGLQEGFEKGLAHAREMTADALQAQHNEIAQQGAQLIESMTAQLAALQQSMAEAVTALAVEIARSATGAALRLDIDLVSPAVQEALDAIIDEHARPTVRLNPYDASMLSDHLAPALATRNAHLVPDGSVGRGGCRIDTPKASVDATLKTRWQRALAALGKQDTWVDA